MKKNIIFLLIDLIIIYWIAKLVLLYKYANYPYLTDDYLIEFKDTITISSKEYNENYDYFELLDNVKIRNDFKDFELSYYSDYFQLAIYSNKTNNDSIVNNEKVISIVKSPSYFWSLKNKKIFELLTIKDSIKFLNKHNITNDIELFQYLSKIEDLNQIRNSIFTSIFKIKDNHITQAIIDKIEFNNYYLTLIEGDYSGLIKYPIHDNDSNTVLLYKDDYRYAISFSPQTIYTPEYIEELISTIVIE